MTKTLGTFNLGDAATLHNFDNSAAWYDAQYGPAGWHDADYCELDGDCTLAHRHDQNCRCADCFSDFDAD